MTRKTRAKIEATEALANAQSTRREAETRLATADAHLAELRRRNTNGDAAVTGLDLITAEADVQVAQGLASHASEVVGTTQVALAHVVADEVAKDVSKTFPAPLVDERVEAVRAQASQALTSLVGALRERDAACDAAGERLASAGVPQREWVGRLRYSPVCTGSSQRPIPGQWNLWIDGEQITRRDGHDSTRREIERLTQNVVASALSDVNLRWGSHGVESAR